MEKKVENEQDKCIPSLQYSELCMKLNKYLFPLYYSELLMTD